MGKNLKKFYSLKDRFDDISKDTANTLAYNKLEKYCKSNRLYRLSRLIEEYRREERALNLSFNYYNKYLKYIQYYFKDLKAAAYFYK